MNNIALLSVPRSGSTWLGQILNSSPEVLYRFQPNFAYTFPHTLGLESTERDIHFFHENLYKTEDPFVCGKLSISGKNTIEFPKKDVNTLIWKETHFVFLAETLLKNSNTKVIGLIRSPFSVVSSWIKIPKEFNPEWSVREQWRFGELKNEGRQSHYFGFEKWKQTSLLFDKLEIEYPNQFFLVNYEDLLKTTMETMTNLFDFSGLELSEQTLQFIRESRSTSVKDDYGVFKKREIDDGWKNVLPEFIVKKIKGDPDYIALNKKYNWLE